MGKTHEQFMKDFMERNSNAKNIEVLDRYTDSRIKIKCKCKVCGHIWEVVPYSLIRKNRNTSCPQCFQERNGKNRRYTHEQFMEKFMEKNPKAKDIEILDRYINKRTNIKCKCKIDGNIWEARPSDLLQGKGCFVCGNRNRTKTHEEFVKELEKVNSDIEVLDTYVNSKTKIKCKCKKDGYIWEITPNDLLHGYSCPKCYGNARKTTEEFVEEMKIKNSDIEILGEYTMNKAKIECKCKVCGNTWFGTPNALLKGNGCPSCANSKGERVVAKYLKDNEIDFIEQYKFEDCKYTRLLPFDFYIPSLNMTIEYDGEQHFRPIEYFGGEEAFKETQLRDNIKTEYCKKNNIKLIRIPYYDFDNIEEILEKELEKVLTLNK